MKLELFMIRDNATRWNSSYKSIHRTPKLKPRFISFLIRYKAEIGDDTLNEDDWQLLADLETILAPFQSVTKRLGGNTKDGTHGLAWEALPAIEALILHLYAVKKVYTIDTHPELATS